MITLLSLSVSGTLLLLLVLGLKPIYKNRFSRRWQYYIWIIVVLRFLLPVTSGDTLVGRLFEKLNATEITSASRTDINMTGITNIDYRVQDDTPINTIPQAETIQHASSGLKMYLFAVWLTIASALFIRNITIYQDFTRYVRAGNKEVSDIHILNILSDCEEKLNIKARVQLYQNAMIVSPILIGFFHPCILLPMEEVGNKELSYIFTHELIHYRKKDMFYKWLVQIAVCVHWFNPFVYLLAKQVNRTCELSCDEAVILTLGDKTKREYGDMLISFAKAHNQYKSSLVSVTLTEGAEQLKERLGAIMKFKKKSKIVVAATVIFSAAVCTCFLVIGAYAAPSTTNNNAMIRNDTFSNSEPSASYEKLTAYKTENYPQQSVADFNAALASTPDELTELLAAQADVINEISPDDENYDFFTTTLQFSTTELYCKDMEEEVTFCAGISKQTLPSEWLDEEGEIWYEFNCFADLHVAYSINSPERVTVAERDNTLLTFEEEMQNYLNSLSEAEIIDGNIKTKLTDKAAELLTSLSTENMKLLSCEISIEIND